MFHVEHHCREPGTGNRENWRTVFQVERLPQGLKACSTQAVPGRFALLVGGGEYSLWTITIGSLKPGTGNRWCSTWNMGNRETGTGSGTRRWCSTWNTRGALTSDLRRPLCENV